MIAASVSRDSAACKAYNSGSTMARTLESLVPGTPVFAGSTRVGDVVAVYAEGEARIAELVIVKWAASGDDVAVPTTEIESIDAQGVQLIRREADQYKDLAPFDVERFPTLRKIA
ncbi:hypothetical protein WPS_22310 [Vulcanimicrobium alpinum]|uniref:Uncharacterized protein n=2 Tax=Vulcanimicrobium alpinum TaxID=3016050 RepID=A0AAN1XXX6_UNVUL|nr:hypothetical protein WPS_22310 [Vulcanimicrobium alpinum]